MTVGTFTEVEPQDLAMDAFRLHFPLISGCFIESDGKTMRYDMQSPIVAAVWQNSAQKVIKAHDLPLVTEVKVKVERNGEMEVTLLIIYKP